MEALFTTEIAKFRGDERLVYEDTLVHEIKLEIFVNGTRIGALMTTPTNERALAVGYLMSENTIASIKDIKSIEQDDMGIRIETKIDETNLTKLNAEGVIISSCGRAHTANTNPEAIQTSRINSKAQFSEDQILKQMGEFYTQCELYKKAGCMHTIRLFVNEKNSFIGKDIAQHNTIDKALDKARLAGAGLQNCFLMVSGRLNSKMVAKAVMHKIPAFISHIAPTCLGVMIARRFNFILYGLAREDEINIYSGEDRINE